MGDALTEAEQNRLIVDHMYLVAPIAARYAAQAEQKGITPADLEAEGRVGLVKAGRMWRQLAKFSTYATHKIHSAIQDFIRAWKGKLVSYKEIDIGGDPDSEPEKELYEWEFWPYRINYSTWNRFDATPEELAGDYDKIAGNHAAFCNAMLSLKKRDREMVDARFLREPQKMLADIAREHKISYWLAVRRLDSALDLMNEIVRVIEANARESGMPMPA